MFEIDPIDPGELWSTFQYYTYIPNLITNSASTTHRVLRDVIHQEGKLTVKRKTAKAKNGARMKRVKVNTTATQSNLVIEENKPQASAENEIEGPSAGQLMKGLFALLMTTLLVGGAYTTMVFNEAKLDAPSRSRLWRWRLGHPAPEVVVRASKTANNINCTHVLNED